MYKEEPGDKLCDLLVGLTMSLDILALRYQKRSVKHDTAQYELIVKNS